MTTPKPDPSYKTYQDFMNAPKADKEKFLNVVSSEAIKMQRDNIPDPILVEIEKIVTKVFNDFYDYITERDIIKAAHEYSEKTIYKEATQAIYNLILDGNISLLLKVLAMNGWHEGDWKQAITEEIATLEKLRK